MYKLFEYLLIFVTASIMKKGKQWLALTQETEKLSCLRSANLVKQKNHLDLKKKKKSH